MKKVTLEIPDRDERGVSPVIGVILMVAITVILAAVIASFVLGFGGSVNESVQAGVDVSENGDGTATVTWISEGTASELEVSVENVTEDDGTDDVTLEQVGDSATIQYDSDGDDSTISVGSDGDVQVTVIGIGSEGTRTVITQEEVTLEDQNEDE
ncbi:type IV pilin [Halobacterium salinarum]|nr:archaellin/type IV pilin N-terminal domain-containing protein [Halobacterium salinarum]MDL0131356.1 type IV pilin [Halobacterium salinarum]